MTVQRLRRTIRSIEGRTSSPSFRSISLGCPELDRSLPWNGLPIPALHEVSGIGADAFTAALASRLLADSGALIWCEQEARSRRLGHLHGPGLARFGIRPDRLLLVRCRTDREVLESMEEALRSGAVACVVGEVERPARIPGRRLQLAAEEGGTSGLLLAPPLPDPGPLAVHLRFRVDFLPLPDAFAFRVDLWRIRSSLPRSWKVQWNEKTLSFSVCSEPATRPDPATTRPHASPSLPAGSDGLRSRR